MPRKQIELSNRVEYLNILDLEGNADAALDPNLDANELRKLFRAMLLARRYDERMLKLQRQGRIGTYGPALGQEAASLGPAYVLDKDDWMAPSFREPAGMLYRGWPMEKLILWWGGNETGSSTPAGVNDTPICVPVSSQCLYAAGIAWGCKLKGGKNVALGFVGDGGTSEGDFHEALNVAGAFQLPLVIVIQNNHWAISLPRQKQSAAQTLAQKAIAYGMDGLQVDGNDLLAMVVATREAVKHARSGKGPMLIEAVTYRMGVHTTADDPKKYRTEEEVACWQPKDPLERFWKYLVKKKVMDEKAREALEAELSERITEAVAKAEAYEPDLTEPFRHSFADMPPSLKEQFAEFQAYLEASNRPDNGSTPSAHDPLMSRLH